MAETLAWLIPLAPLTAAIMVGAMSLAGLKRSGHYLVIGTLGISALIALANLFTSTDGIPILLPGYHWLDVGAMNIGIDLRLDPLSLAVIPVITGVSFLVACYSIGYMTHDAGFTRYFAVFAGFVFSMTMLVLANNLLVLYAFWEGVGLCSYLLIGHWYERPSAAAAAKKAFLVNRIADAGFLLGILLLWNAIATLPSTPTEGLALLDFGTIFQSVPSLMEQSPATVMAIGFLLLLGAIGKSAQFPLHVWLPDAMEGPTPVSALIHAATMVTAGVYLLARMMPLLVEVPAVLTLAAILGGVTALLGALMATGQHDLKRILAYSTVSQLGFMFLALGSATSKEWMGAAVTAALFHLVTHAFFKALLFLAAGNVMHAMGDVIDLRRISGLQRVLPQTRWLFLVGALALAGIPPLAGFWSKDSILVALAEATHGPAGAVYAGLFLVALVSALLTALYSMSAYFQTFHGVERIPAEAGHHPHEAHPTMIRAMGILALGSIVAGGWIALSHSLEHLLGRMPGMPVHPHEGEPWGILAISTVTAIAGAVLAWMGMLPLHLEPKGPGLTKSLRRSAAERFYVDAAYDRFITKPIETLSVAWAWFDLYIVDGAARAVGFLPALLGYIVRPFQSGLVPTYAFVMAASVVAMLFWASW